MAQQVMAPVTASDVGNWLKWLVEQEHAGAVSLASRAHQGLSMALQGANVALSYPGALLSSFLTGEPATVPDFRPYDPWKDPVFLRAQMAMGRPVPTSEASTTRRPSEQTSKTPTEVTPSRRSETEATRSAGDSGTRGSDLGSMSLTVTPVPDQILSGKFATVEDIQRAGLTPTYFLTPALIAANADRPIMPTGMPNVGDLTKALSQGPIPDQVLMGLYPSVEAMRAAGAQPTYVLSGVLGRMQPQAAVAGQVMPQTASQGQRSGWINLFKRQQDVLDVLGVTTETGQALRLAARRAAQTPGASVAALYWEQGFEPLLRRYGVSEEQLRKKEQELRALEAEWRRYGMPQDFAEFLWTQGFDPFS